MHGTLNKLAHRALKALFAAIIFCFSCGSIEVLAADFQGAWRSVSSMHANASEGNSTTLNLRQFGSVICGEWAENVGTGKILGGNVTGRISGRTMRVNIGEDIYWARAGRFPHQNFESALFVLQGRKLIWYSRDKYSRPDKIQTFERVRSNDNPVHIDFMDRQFARLCPTGADFLSVRR